MRTPWLWGDVRVQRHGSHLGRFAGLWLGLLVSQTAGEEAGRGQTEQSCAVEGCFKGGGIQPSQSPVLLLLLSLACLQQATEAQRALQFETAISVSV